MKPKASLVRALLLPLAIALGLAALLFRPPSARSRLARPPLLLPVAFDELVDTSARAPASESGVGSATAEGLRSWKAP